MPTSRLHEPLLAWFDAHKRDLPWRRTRDPYAIWVSEIMLQQTQVATVIPYWERWMARFPTVALLAAADEQEVLSLWQGLGYYRRCRMLHAGAKWVAVHGMPTDATGWLSVPGVGRYTAGAIASIAFQQPTPVVDGNVERVFSRLEECSEAGPRLTKSVWQWAANTLSVERPGDWNQALMELGATACRPLSPLCKECPLSFACKARLNGDPTSYPVKMKPRSLVNLQFHVLVPVSSDGRYGVRQIAAGQWWEGMWEFPRELEFSQLPDLKGEASPLGQVRHQVTHHRIDLVVSIAREVDEDPILRWVPTNEMGSLPMPAPQRKIYGLAREPRLF